MKITFVIEQRPDTGSVCPILDLTDPIIKGVLRSLLQKMVSMPMTSSGSPTCVP